MALSLDTEFKGIPVKSAYVTVEFPSIGRTKDSIEFGLWFRSSPGAESFRTESLSASYDIGGPDPFKQAYEHLKTLTEFENSTDC